MGVIIPKEIVDAQRLKEDDEIDLLLLQDSSRILQEMWDSGMRTKKSAQKIKDELRRELYGD